MEVPNDVAAFSDPIDIARRSGMTLRPVHILPRVPRPFMLTTGLAGCSCGENLGQYDPTQPLMRNDSMGDLLPPSMGDLLPPVYFSDSMGLGLVLPDGFDLGEDVPSAGTGNVSIINAIAAGANFIPGIGQVAGVAISSVNQAISMFESWFGIGAGRREADIITPVQNNFMARLGSVTDQIRLPLDPSLAVLQGLYREVWMASVAFVEFVLMKTFIDRRASGQALNGVLPYIDGTCAYPVPIGPTAHPGATGCPLPFGDGPMWGTGTVGGPGTNGMLGAIARAIQLKGGTVQTLPSVEDAANQGYKLAETPPTGGGGPTLFGLSTPLAVGIGALALYFFSRRTPRG